MTRISSPTKTEPTEREVAIAKKIVEGLVRSASNSDRKRKKTYQKGRGMRVLKEIARQLNEHLQEEERVYPMSVCCNAVIVTQAPGSGDLSTECSSCRLPSPEMRQVSTEI